jgi:hypothetical protein
VNQVQQALVAAICVAAQTAVAAELAENSTEGWTVSSKASDLTLYSRPHPGSALKEFKAVGGFEASTELVHRVLDDVESYPSFMPYMAECRILKREGDYIFTYQRLAPHIVSQRDYTLRGDEKSWKSGQGLAFLKRWQTANEAGPPPQKGVVRVSVSEGSWLLEPDGPDKTRATYSVFSDTGGALPAFIANGAAALGIKKVFAAVRKQVQDPKYRK